jgi:signal transduction histidine kinase
VEKVRRFRDVGVHEPLGDWEGDELAVLAHALDVSFAAIAARDQERDRFLAVAAHELKTPLTTVKGYAQAALAHGADAALRERALVVIDRQASRLARLVQDLLWSARARGGQLSFQPAPLDLAVSAQHVIAEMELAADGHTFPLTVHGETCVLGDACLVEQSLSSVVREALAMAPARAPVPVTLDGCATSVRLTVEAWDVEASLGDVEKLMEPFAVLQFEGRPHDATRGTGLGLYLAREIARLHAGALRIERRAGGSALLFVLEFRR